MCGKLPTGSVGFVPSGRAPAASGSGVPHHGGAIVTARAAPAHVSATAVPNAPSPSRSNLLRLVDTSFHLLGRKPTGGEFRPHARGHKTSPSGRALAVPAAGRAFIDDLIPVVKRGARGRRRRTVRPRRSPAPTPSRCRSRPRPALPARRAGR